MHPTIDPEPTPGELDRAAALLSKAARVALLSGAGISAESGVATFRGAGGLWEGHNIMEVATPEAFASNPQLVWRFYNARRNQLQTVQPNPGHTALVQMEDRWTSERFTVCTQNVDGLHRQAGSRNVLELHGSLARVRCTGCRRIEHRPNEKLPDLPVCDACGHLLRPDIVWFHEMLPEDVWLKAAEAASECECFLVIGTSAVVYPAAHLVEIARRSGASVIEVNLERTDVSHSADLSLQGKSGFILPEIVRRLV